MDKQFNPGDLEKKWQAIWEELKIGQPSNQNKKFSIMFPPPNVTGNLHMGHGFLITVSDIYVRYQRMKKQNVLWQMGTDHAGIATQIVVSRECERKGIDPKKIGRERFLDQVNEWVKDVKIHDQIKAMGASVDWSTAMFTMDPDHSHAVRQSFIKLYRDQLIYRGKRLANWDTTLQTALSDLEVENREENGSLYHIIYPFNDKSGQVTIATTRPETLLGDVAVAVHPDDERFKNELPLLQLPLTDRIIPIIKDDYVDQSFGTGCLKITPAHDFNDYEVGQRHALDMINILSPTGHLNENVPEKYQGLTVVEARKKIITDLEALGLLVKVEKHTHMVPYGERSGTKIEPLLTDQWFVKMKPLADPAIKCVIEKKIELIPENHSKTYFHFLENIQDWCISRQIWWGHRIPAWYDEEGNVYVGENEVDVRKHYTLDETLPLKQDDDVLDTWFSSSIYPFSALGWPQKTARLSDFFPTDLLITGYDILFFWVARMIMMSLYLTGEIPFSKVFLHGLFRDEKGQKMSKSKGNIIDPLDLIQGIQLDKLIKKRTQGMMQPKIAEKVKKQTQQSYPDGIEANGTDALRMCYASSANPGRDIRFSLEKLRGYKFFCNKLWNATRFLTMLSGDIKSYKTIDECLHNPADFWIIDQFNQMLSEVEKHIHDFRFDLLAKCLYEFTWHQFCDWYIEFVKINIQNDPKSPSFTVAHFILEQLLRTLHPIMPYITESLWQIVAKPLKLSSTTVALLDYPSIIEIKNPINLEGMKWCKECITQIRTLRSECNLPPSKPIKLQLSPLCEQEKKWLNDSKEWITKMCQIESIEWVNQPDSVCARATIGPLNIDVPLKGLIDAEVEYQRISKTITKTETLHEKLKAKLNNARFLENAPKDLIEKEKQLLEEQISNLNRLKLQQEKIHQLL
ncbi:MAG: valine--tRNA ligase [Legionellales bacterium]|nr:valine--tRNA ligase [Legionellales bacterium]